MLTLSTASFFALVILTVPKKHLTASHPTHPKLQLKSYKLFATNRTVEQNETHLFLPKVFDELEFECNSSVPTVWLYSGHQTNDPTIKKIEVNKWRLINEPGTPAFEYRSTLKILFSNPVEMINMTCENICSEENKSCQKLNAFLELIESHHISQPFFDLRYFYGNESLTSLSEDVKSQLVGDAWLGTNKDCKYALHVDLESGKYACVKSSNIKYEVPSIFIPCGNPDECDNLFKNDEENCNNTITFQRNCTHPHCSEIRDTTSPFVIACGEINQFSVARSFFKTLDSFQRGDKKLYEFQPKSLRYSDGELVNVTMNTLAVSNKRYGVDNTTIYFGYPREFECIALRSLFSHGIRWRLRYKDNSVKDLGLGRESINDIAHLHISKKTIIFDSLFVESVICEAPNWNSFHRTASSFNVSIQKSAKPSNPEFRLIKRTNAAEIREALIVSAANSNQNLTCFRSGTPPALISWAFDGVKLVKSLENDTKSTHYTLQESEEMSEVILSSGHPFREIVCTLKNVAGTSAVHFKFKSAKDPTVVITISICSGIVLVLLAFIVWKIRKNKNFSFISEEAIREFYDGTTKGHQAFTMPYNVQLEISPESVTTDNLVLGSGEYGKVLKGRIGLLNVAIKLTKSTNDNTIHMKSLLSEIKIMAYVGNHPYIVNLIGACTMNIRKNELRVILEFCERGDLLSILRESRNTFVNLFERPSMEGNADSASIATPLRSHMKLSTRHLLHWAISIAEGMQFIGDKNIIHADLAARNVLITSDLRAKVSDFGLSKHLYEYSVYVKKGKVALPVRWMAYECLKNLEFSTQSDIWSFGVVLWEMFSLGNIPYYGIPWNFQSWNLLAEGTRLAKPAFASDEIFELMKLTWNILTTERPSFESLKESIIGVSRRLPEEIY